MTVTVRTGRVTFGPGAGPWRLVPAASALPLADVPSRQAGMQLT
jgi:hypothetical protein